MEAGANYGIRPFGIEAQRVLRLEKAHLIVGQDTDALSDPLSAGMGWAVKMEKGDFLGQKSLVRVAQNGPTQRLVGFTMEGTARDVPEEGLQIVRTAPSGQMEIIGWVTSGRWRPTLGQIIGLCWLPPHLANRPGAPFSIRMKGGLVGGTVHHGAFYDPKGTRLRS